MRMAYTMRRAIKVLSATSLTMATAFLANGFSPMMPIKALGIYAAIIIPVNFIFTICLMPAAIVWHEKYFGTCFARCIGYDIEAEMGTIGYGLKDVPDDGSFDDIMDMRE